MGGLAHFVVSSSLMIYFSREVSKDLNGCEREGGKAARPVLLLTGLV